jgi:hypothetical protein
MWTIICFVVLVALNPSQIEAKDLSEILRHRDDIDTIYNEICDVEWTKNNLQIARDLWNGNYQKYQNIPVEKVTNDIVRLALANILMQARRQCRVDIEMTSLHEYVRGMTTSDNLKIKGRATYLLGLAGYDTDIPFLSSVVRAEKPGYAEEAALSLMFLHSEAALAAIKELAGSVTREDLKNFLLDLENKYAEYPLANDVEVTGCNQE